MKRTHTLRARSGTYRDRNTGQEKNSYITVGHILSRDDGTTMYKLDSLPVDFDGWLYPGELPTKGFQNSPPQGKDAAAEQKQIETDDIPF